MIFRTIVASRAVRSIGFENDALEVEFATGGIYRYIGVPRQVFDKILSAQSLGSAVANELVHNHIYRNGHRYPVYTYQYLGRA